MDLDAFFASVEQLDHPEWRGKPVIVGGSPERRGVVSTASYEARPYGVHSAMPSWQARRLCPQAIWTHGHYARYRELSDQVMAIIGNETPLVEQVSIDEAFFDVTPGRYSHESPIDICRRIQGRVAELGITCSIGLGVNKTVAKIASERQKPRGLTVVLPGTEAAFLAPLPVRVMSGIGAATESTSASWASRTLGQLAAAGPASAWSSSLASRAAHGRARRRGARSSQVRAIDAPEEVKSVSNERTFAHDLTTRDELEAAIDHVSALAGARLRRKGLAGTQVTLKLKFDIHHTHTAQRQLDEPTDDEHVFGAVARSLLDGLWREGTGVRLVGVAVSGFDGDGPSSWTSLTKEPDERGQAAQASDLRALSVATDDIRSEFGKGTP